MSFDTITTTLHYDVCGCATWADIDGVHICPCLDVRHVAALEDAAMSVSRAIGLDIEVVRHALLPDFVLDAIRTDSPSTRLR